MNREQYERIGRQPHYVYRYYDADGRAIYIGCTNNPEKRERDHRNKPWFSTAVRREIDKYPNRETGRAAEKEAIRREHPRENLALAVDYVGQYPMPRIGYRRLIVAAARARARLRAS